MLFVKSMNEKWVSPHELRTYGYFMFIYVMIAADDHGISAYLHKITISPLSILENALNLPNNNPSTHTYTEAQSS